MPLPDNASHKHAELICEMPALTIKATADFYILQHHPRGRIVRCVPLSGDEYSIHVAQAAPLTNLQRAVEMAKRLEWLDQKLTIEDLEYSL